MTSRIRGHRTPAYRALLTVVVSLLLGVPAAAVHALPAHAAYTPVVVEDQTFNVRGDQGLSLYLKSSGGDTDGTIVRWSTSGAPSWLDVQPNGYVTGLVPPAGGTFTFTITGTSGTYAGASVSADSATATIVAEPIDFNISFGGSDHTTGESSAPTLKRIYVGIPVKTSVGAAINNDAATWTATNLPPGLTLASDGKIAGTATRVGTFPLTVTVTYRGAVATRTLTLITSSAMLISTGGYGNQPRVTVGRPFVIKMRVVGNVGKTTFSFAAKRPSGYKLKRTSSTTYKLTGKLPTRKKVRIPVKLVDQSGASVTTKLIVTPYPR